MLRDNVDPEFLERPKSWDTKSLLYFMLCMGPLSSPFDITTFCINWYDTLIRLFSLVANKNLWVTYNAVRVGSNTASEPLTLRSSPVLMPIGSSKALSLRFVILPNTLPISSTNTPLAKAVHHPLPAYTQDTIHPITGFYAPHHRHDHYRVHCHGYSMDPGYFQGLEVRTPRTRILWVFGGDRGGLFVARANWQNDLFEVLQNMDLGFLFSLSRNLSIIL
jgi:hypothetical protein